MQSLLRRELLEEEIVALSGRGAFVCSCDSPKVDTLVIRRLEKVYYERALGQPIRVTRELAMSEIRQATEILQE